jgi:RNA polymerase sigma factor (sigma-70 family)
VGVKDEQSLAAEFEIRRPHLRAVAYRMLGSSSEADDAVQETWLRLGRSDTSGVENLGAWLTTVVGRVCLDMLRARKIRGTRATTERDALPGSEGGSPEEEASLADSVGLALLVVLDTLDPAERLAFVLHDSFGLPFEEVAPVVGRSPAAARQLASRARRRVRAGAVVTQPDQVRQRRVVEAYLAAARGGDFDALLEVLDPGVVLRLDPTMLPAGAPADAPLEIRGAQAVAQRATAYRARAARPVLVDGVVGVLVAPGGRLSMVLLPTIADGKIVAIEVVAEPERLRRLELRVLPD